MNDKALKIVNDNIDWSDNKKLCPDEDCIKCDDTECILHTGEEDD